MSTPLTNSTCKNRCKQVTSIYLYKKNTNMNRLDLLLNKFFDNFEFLGPVVLKSLLGIAFILYGSQKFPLPAEGLLSMGFTAGMAIIVPLIEVGAGLGILVSIFIKGVSKRLLTRISALVIFCFMIAAIFIAHQDWLVNAKLFKSVQIFLLGVSFYFIVSPGTISESKTNDTREEMS